MVAPDVLQLQDHNTRDNFCKTYFYPATIKTDNGSVAMIFILVQYERNQQLHKIKKNDDIVE